MMIEGSYRDKRQFLPRVVTMSVTSAPLAGDGSVPITVRWHEESGPVSWLRHMVLSSARATEIRQCVAEVDSWAQNVDPSLRRADRARTTARLGRLLHRTFVGAEGEAFLADHPPTALMVEADEFLLDLPWELISDAAGPLALRHPFGRIVSTRTRPRPERDPTQEDSTIRVLVVADPTRDFGDVEQELAAVRRLAGAGDLALDVLAEDDATHAALADSVSRTRYDILHLSCHGGFSRRSAADSGLLLADGPLLTDQILSLPFAAPPYLAITSACWSTRSATGRRLTSTRNGRLGGNGVAAAFLALGASACAGFSMPVTVTGAAVVSDTFYEAVVSRRNVGTAIMKAREAAHRLWATTGDPAVWGFTYFGDAGSAQRAEQDPARLPGDPSGPPRRDLATAE